MTNDQDFPITGVLAATDLSVQGDGGLERAASLAAAHAAKLTVVHVVDEALPAKLAKRLQGDAERVIRERLATLPEVEIDLRIPIGKPHSSILALADEIDASLLVLGAHRSARLTDLFRGTTAERVVRFGHVPVLLVRTPPTAAYERVLVGMDFSTHARRAMVFARHLVPGSRVLLVHAHHLPYQGLIVDADADGRAAAASVEWARQQAEAEFEKLVTETPSDATPPKYLLREGDARSVLREEVRRMQADLLVLGTHGRTGVAHALLGSVTEDMLAQSPCDVLAVKAW